MRTALLAHLVGMVACGDLDRAAPILVDARDLAGTHLGVADTRAPLAEPPVRTTTRPTVALIFSELLDGDAVQEVVIDPHTGAVRELVGRDGIIRVAPTDGSVVAESVAYHPGARSIEVVPRAHLPAETAILIHVMAERVWDAQGNVVPVARYADGEPVRDLDGRGIAATVAFETGPIELVAMQAPAYGTADDPDTEVDDSVPYDAAIAVELNTVLDPASVVASIIAVGSGDVIAVNASAGGPTEIWLTPSAPLAPETAYELRLESATDLYDVPWREPPLLMQFSTL